MRRIYCGGRFDFDYQHADYRKQAAQDYRAMLLGSTDLLLQKSSGILINDSVEYIGPFYFETDSMVDTDIVCCETKMVHRCTDAIFLLNEADCPGTVCELTLASILGKRVHVFYLRNSNEEETESTLHTPCWYPILFNRITNRKTDLYECSSAQDASEKICTMIQGWKQPGADTP